ncbi:hypothetical protein FFY45_17365 [Xanthomonas hortorum]|nr:hypothetical protein [Xanthomonas hortorum]
MGSGDDRHQRHQCQNRPWAQSKMSERHRRQYSGKAGRVAAGATPGQGGTAGRVSGPLDCSMDSGGWNGCWLVPVMRARCLCELPGGMAD